MMGKPFTIYFFGRRESYYFIMKQFINYYVNYPLLAWMTVLFLILAGILALFSLRSEAFPNVDFHQVKITTVFPGSPPSDIEQLVTYPLEEKIREVDGLDQVRSISRQSVSEILVKVDLEEEDPDEIINDIQKAIDQVSDLPEQVSERPLFEESKSGKFPIMELSVFGDLSEYQLYSAAKLVEKQLEKLPGVARVDLFGERDREWHVLIDPQKMANLNVNLYQVIQSIKSRNVNIPAGSFSSGKARNIRTTGEFETPDQILDLPIIGNEVGNTVRLGLFARVRDTFKRPDFLASTEGLPAINLLVLKKEKADILKTIARVKQALQRIQPTLKKNAKVTIINDEGKRTKNRLDVVSSNALIGFVLVVLILVLFLSLRDSILTSISLPLTLFGMLVIFPVYDITFNLVSMLGIIISLGMLVDNSIVISENIYRHRQNGLNAVDAAVRGASELVIPIFGTYLTTVAAFLPMMFMSGIMGRFIWQIPFAVICTLTISLFESFFLLPARMSQFSHRKIEGQGNIFRRTMDGFFDLLRDKIFARIIDWIIRFRYIFFTFFLVSLGLTFYTASKMKFNLFPREGSEIFIIKVEFAPDIRVTETLKRMKYIEEIIRSLPEEELVSYSMKAGIQQKNSQDVLTRVGEHLGVAQVFLTPELKRERKAAQIIASIEDKIRAIPEANEVLIEEVVPSPPIGAAITLAVQGDDYQILQKISAEIRAFLQSEKGILNISDDYKPGREEYVVKLNQKVAAQTGIGTLQAATLIRAAYEGNEVSSLRQGPDEITIRVLYDNEHRGDPGSINHIKIPNKYGLNTAIGSISYTQVKTGPEALLHYDFERAITITADVDDSIITSNIANDKVWQKFKDIGQKYPGYSVQFRGEQESTKKSMISLAKAGVVALFAIYAILTLIFNSTIKPLVITATIPLGIVGVVIGFLTAGKSLSFFALIGIIGLAGVVVNSSIVLVDFIEQAGKQGVDQYRALSEAATVRFRPILLTTMTTMGGLLPTAYGIGGSDPVLIPMTLALAWGLASGTFGALTFIPCVFSIGYDLAALWQKLVKRG